LDRGDASQLPASISWITIAGGIPLVIIIDTAYYEIMTGKPLEYSAHARQRMAERGITRTDIRWLLASGIPVNPPQRAGAVLRHRVRGYIAKQEALMVFVEEAHRTRIVTVMWLA
jgi:hypothetical protein